MYYVLSRAFLTPYLTQNPPPTLPASLFSKFDTPQSRCSFYCLVSYILPNDVMDLHTLSVVTLVVCYATRHQFTETKTQHTKGQAKRLMHSYKYIWTPSIMHSKQLSVLHKVNNFIKNLLYWVPQCLCFLKITDFLKSQICWLSVD